MFTPDAIYEGVYANAQIRGAAAIGLMLGKVIPAALDRFRQWPIGILSNSDGTSLSIEYRSDGIAPHNGAPYRNFYTGLIRLKGDRIAFWREYYDPSRFAAAVGPNFPRLVEQWMPAGSMTAKPADHPAHTLFALLGDNKSG
ncbi:MAG: hypothetical protein CFE35_12925 [Novosphingobium sp. PASSN1]|nr:MAG: hypothetical protein CFE35_12925 [Novosphingobium sp. PASSN1]